MFDQAKLMQAWRIPPRQAPSKHDRPTKKQSGVRSTNIFPVRPRRNFYTTLTNDRDKAIYLHMLQNRFEKIAQRINRIVGSPHWFFFSIALIIIWLPTGLIFGFGDTWQLVINTTTTILTFLMVSLLQTSQNTWEKRMDEDQEREKRNLKIILEEVKKLEDAIKTSTPPTETPKVDQIS